MSTVHPRPSEDLPSVETEVELRVRYRRLGGRLVALGWLLALLAALVGGSALPTGGTGLTLAGLGMAAGALTAIRSSRHVSAATPHVSAATLTVHAIAAAVALDATGTAAAAAFLLAAGFAGATITSRRAAALHIAAAALAPVGVALLVEGRLEGAAQSAAALAPAIAAVGVVGAVLRDHAARREATLRMLARRDPLTGVGNYRRLHERLAETVATDPARFALLTMDVDSFKAINDRYGHLEGDRLLREVGKALVDNVRGKDVVARQGGDEFAVLAPETDERGAELLAHRIERALEEIEIGEENRAAVRASIGIAVYPKDGRTPEELLARSDDALRRTKEQRRHPIGA